MAAFKAAEVETLMITRAPRDTRHDHGGSGRNREGSSISKRDFYISKIYSYVILTNIP
jgi:hypothetical protein